MESHDTQHIPRGWQCPKCKSVYAPQVPMCEPCGDASVKRTASEPVSNRSAAKPPVFTRYRC